MRFWIGTVSREHALRGIQGGFTQVCHGKRAPLARMKKNDWFIFYSPKQRFMEKAPCQKFVGVGLVKTGEVYQFKMSERFHPFRIDIDYKHCREVEIAPLIDQLTFIRNKKSWGMAFRYGHIEIPENDFITITTAMLMNAKKPAVILDSIEQRFMK